MTTAAFSGAGERMYALMSELFPICRSITGDGVRRTLGEIAAKVPLAVHEVPTGTPVLDWTVPDEWNVADAYLADSSGARVVDFRQSNLHVVGYSEPVRARMSLADLRPHLHADPERPESIPYRTTYYTRDWGLCLSQRQLDGLADETYEVVIDSSLEHGALTYGECLLPGERDEEILLTTHVCHPSLANDNLSGIAVLTELAAALASRPRRLSYRLLFLPGTIGAIAWLARNEDSVSKIVGGLVLACVGDAAPLTYKRTRHGDAAVDRAASHVLRHLDDGARVIDFAPWGWDERQFNSPGFALPVGCLSRSRDGEYPQYHSSADDLDIVHPEQLEEAFHAVLAIGDILETDRRYLNVVARGEPQLGRRGLYREVGGLAAEGEQMVMLWLLNQSDGRASLLDVAERAGITYERVRDMAGMLVGAGLLVEADLS